MKETIVKTVTDAFIKLKLGDIIERLDRRVSTLADRVAVLELVNRPMKTPDTPRMRCMMPMVI
jgi:hypothetical protein